MSWINKVAKRWIKDEETVSYCEIKKGVYGISNGFIFHIQNAKKLTRNFTDRRDELMKGVVSDVLKSEKENDYVTFSMSKEDLKSIISSDSDWFVFSVNKNIVDNNKPENCIIVRHEGSKKMTISTPCTTSRMSVWSPENA